MSIYVFAAVPDLVGTQKPATNASGNVTFTGIAASTVVYNLRFPGNAHFHQSTSGNVRC